MPGWLQKGCAISYPAHAQQMGEGRGFDPIPWLARTARDGVSIQSNGDAAKNCRMAMSALWQPVYTYNAKKVVLVYPALSFFAYTGKNSRRAIATAKPWHKNTKALSYPAMKRQKNAAEFIFSAAESENSAALSAAFSTLFPCSAA